MDGSAGRGVPLIATVVCVALLLALTGRRRRAASRRDRRDEEYLDLLGVLTAGLEAGLHPMDAVALSARGREAGHVLSRTADAWTHRGRSVDECLTILAAHFDGGPTPSSLRRGSHLAATLASHLVDGHPLEATVEQMVRDFRESTRRATEARVRELPVRLSPPLVLCILPSFMLACTLPLAALTRGSFIGTEPDLPFTSSTSSEEAR